MKALKGVVTALLLLALAAVPAGAHCYEVGFRVLDEHGEVLANGLPVTVVERVGGLFVKTVTTSPGVEDSNFFIDFQDPEDFSYSGPFSCTGSNVVNLKVGTEYVITFGYPAPTNLCFVRTGCPDYSYDTYYEVSPDWITRVGGVCTEEWDYTDCGVISDLAVTLGISGVNYIGDKIIFTLRAAATGGTGFYTFSWSGASRISATANTNPNYAKRTILKSQTAVVTVTVTSGTTSVQKQITLTGRIP